VGGMVLAGRAPFVIKVENRGRRTMLAAGDLRSEGGRRPVFLAADTVKQAIPAIDSRILRRSEATEFPQEGRGSRAQNLRPDGVAS